MPRVGFRSFKSIDAFLAAERPGEDSFFTRVLRPSAVVLEADWAATRPPLLDRLRLDGVATLMDVHSLRFDDASFRDVDRIASLTFAPDGPLSSLNERGISRFVWDCLDFQAQREVTHYMAPLGPWRRGSDLPRRILAETASIVGTVVPFRPVVAMVAPDRWLMSCPAELVACLSDYGIEQAYVQPLFLDCKRSSASQLFRYIDFINAFGRAGIQVVAGRPGAFGLILTALGIHAFDGGLGEGDRFSLAATVASTAKQALAELPKETAATRIPLRAYVSALYSVLPGEQVRYLLSRDSGLLARLMCDLPCCRFRPADRVDRAWARTHFLYSRFSEVAKLGLPTTVTRSAQLDARLEEAESLSRTVSGRLTSRFRDVQQFEFLGLWRDILRRSSGLERAA